MKFHLHELLWRNPILLMGVRRQLRPKAVIVWGLITFIICLFIFLNVYNSWSFSNYGGQSEANALALKTCFIPMLIAQGIILMFLGTGSVAGGMAEEKESGLLDYQRLTPMMPLSKIIGYLFGLPSREYLLFALTLPFTLIATIGGQIPFMKVLLLYAIFFCVVLAYHLTAMVAGMLAKKPRRASWFARIMVVLLYIFLPALSQMGLTVFGHLTILPTLWGLLESELGENYSEEFLELWEVVPFFSWNLPPALFSFLILGFLMVVFVSILLRKWQQDTNHSMTKYFAIGVFAILQFLMTGSLMPHLDKNVDTSIFLKEIFPFEAELAGAILLIHLLLSLIASILLLHLITPTRHILLKGSRRAEKLTLKKIPFNWDAAGSLVSGLAFIGIASIGFGGLLAAAMQTPSIENEIPRHLLPLPAILFTSMVLYIQAARTIWPTAGFFGFLALLWILPELTGLTLTAFTRNGDPLFYFGITNPLHALYYTLALYFEAFKEGTGPKIHENITQTAYLTLAFHGGLAIFFQLKARRWKQTLALKS